ncbi:MAG: alpha-ketoacid dehydrogenase subunit beta, partial [Deltaproteobacteria bacterium]|nr:alpha-ketoacid dehydrogenase subunit beta [Deltaproteobacteria bacterium]
MAREMTLGEALVEALSEAMERDRRVVLIGGGLVSSGPGAQRFRAVRERHGNRIKSPPIAELGYCGIAAGAAMAGLRPLV